MTIANVTRRSKYIYFHLIKEGKYLSPRQSFRHVGRMVYCQIQLMKLRK